MPCHVCHCPGKVLVPERNPSLAKADDARVYHFCPLCLDAMLAVFPLTPRRIFGRELTGRAVR